MLGRTGEARALTVDQKWAKRFLDLHLGIRGNPAILPRELGRFLALVTSDIHGAVEEALGGLLALPVPLRQIDLGDKLDRGPEPLAANQMLELMGAQRLQGNHDAMWFGAGLGINRLAIELVRWLMRYNEQDFLTHQMGIALSPLEEFAARNFADARGDYKSKLSRPMEAAATYLKIIAEAPYRFPQHTDVVLNESDRRIRSALFHTNDLALLSPGERDIFNRLTGKAKLDERDTDYFYRLMGGLREFTEDEAQVVEYFKRAFMESHAYFQLIECMVGNREFYTTLRMAEGAPYDMLFTHAGVPITAEGELAEYNGAKGKEMFDALERDLNSAMTAWRWAIETGDRMFLEADTKVIDRLGELAWGEQSPLYMRAMQTAARAVLAIESGLFEEPKGPFFKKWVRSSDPRFVHAVCRAIGSSFGLDPRRLLIVHGHEPSEDGSFVVNAGGHDLNIDAGLAPNYGGNGAFLLVGTNGLQRYGLREDQFSRVELNLESF
ncbi:fructose-bisphosphatase class III [Candidatus Saganbacteria bacterium]|nr:fructose-bisphosphatase class III [Candidatus Saganbacteria bacterium]